MTEVNILAPTKQLKTNLPDGYFNCHTNSTDNGDLGSVKQLEGYNGFSAEAFVKTLLSDGSKIPCDAVSKSGMELPPYYDEVLFKKGQAFFYKHIFSILISNFYGLLLLLSTPTADVLIMTNKSNTPMTAYRRYTATILHLCSWYDGSFKPGSSLWLSICKVRKMHDSASKRSRCRLNYSISQRDMAGTVFGLMGFALIRSKMLGIHNATEEEWKSFIHLWRVIGYILGVEDRYNICRESVQETIEVCNVLNIEAISIMDKRTEKFDKLSRAMVSGMQAILPILDYDVALFYLYMLLENTPDTSIIDKRFKPLNKRSMSHLKMAMYVNWLLQFELIRIFFKYIIIFVLYLMKVCPVFAYYRFGYLNSHVKI